MPIPPRLDSYGAYNPVSGLFWCRSRDVCVHEVGHALDHNAGRISRSPEFMEAAQMYLLTNAGKDDRVIHITGFLISRKVGAARTELYAYLFELADGQAENMPESLRKFYDWKLAGKLLARLHGPGFYWTN